MNKRIENQTISEQELRRRLEEAQDTLLQHNEKLAAAERLAHTILDQATEAIVVCDPNGQVVVANQVAQQLSGISPLGRPFLEVFPLRLGPGELPWHGVERRQAPRLGPAVTLDSICNAGPVQRVEVNLPRRDGFKFHLLLSGGPLLGARGEPLGCIITLTDITQLRLAEAALREGEDRFVRLIHSNLLGILVVEEDSIQDANDTFLQMVGRTRAELGLDWHTATSSEYHSLVEQKLKELLDAGVIGPFELDCLHPANGCIPVLISLILLEASPRRWVGFVVNREDRERAKATLDFRVQERTVELSETNQVLEAEIAERRRVEEELRHSRALFESLLESAPDAIIAVDPAGRIVLVNSQTDRMFGYRREELLGQSIELLLPGRFRDLHVAHRTSYNRAPTTRPMGVGLDLWGQRKDGTEFPVEISLSPVRSENSSLIVSIIRDISARKRADESLKEQATRLQEQADLIELAHDTIIVRDLDSRITYWNHGAEETYGWTKPEALGQSTHTLLRTQFPESMEQVESQLLTQGRWEGELVHTARDGRHIVVASRQVLQRDEQGRPRAILEINHDITERKRADEQLRLSEERFRTLVETVHDYAIFGLDSQGHVISWNDGAERLNRYRADEIIGKHFSIFFTPEEIRQGKPEQELRDAAAKGHHQEEAVRVRKDGTPYWADVVVTALRDSQGNLRGFSKVIRDITARKETQEQIRQLNVELERRVRELATLNQELEAFSYSVSHDLRAPLRAIAGFSQALAEDYDATLDEQGKDYTRRINAATQRLTQLIDDLLMLSRVTRSEMNRETSVDLSALANSIASQLQSVQPERRVQFVVQPGLTTRGDAHLLHIALDNLIGNAWKFTSKTPEARIEFGSAGKENGKTVYFVRDNGAGFDMAFVGKLFGPFQRLHSGNEFPGTGIGLATVQRIVHRHGGRVWAEGEVGKGAVVYFTL